MRAQIILPYNFHLKSFLNSKIIYNQRGWFAKIVYKMSTNTVCVKIDKTYNQDWIFYDKNQREQYIYL